MSDDQSSNAQATPPVTTPPSTGPIVDEKEARIQELERAREGLLREVQTERRKRQEYEAQLATSPASSPVPPQDVTNDELAKVLSPYIAPLKKQIEEFQKAEAMKQAQEAEQKALKYLAEQTGKKTDDIMADVAFQDKLVATAKRWNITGNAYDVATRAYELMQLEDIKTKEAERVRAANAAKNTSLPTGVPPSPVSAKEYSADEFNRLDPREFDKLSSQGSFRKDSSGKFVYTPRT